LQQLEPEPQHDSTVDELAGSHHPRGDGDETPDSVPSIAADDLDERDLDESDLDESDLDESDFDESDLDDESWGHEELFTPPPRPKPGVLAGEALVSAMRQGNVSEDDIAAALIALSPPPPPDEDEP